MIMVLTVCLKDGEVLFVVGQTSSGKINYDS